MQYPCSSPSVQVSSVSPVRSWSSMCASSLQTKFGSSFHQRLYLHEHLNPTNPQVEVPHPLRYILVPVLSPRSPRDLHLQGSPTTPDALPCEWHCRAPTLQRIFGISDAKGQISPGLSGWRRWLSCARALGGTSYSGLCQPESIGFTSPEAAPDSAPANLQTQ